MARRLRRRGEPQPPPPPTILRSRFCCHPSPRCSPGRAATLRRSWRVGWGGAPARPPRRGAPPAAPALAAVGVRWLPLPPEAFADDGGGYRGRAATLPPQASPRTGVVAVLYADRTLAVWALPAAPGAGTAL